MYLRAETFISKMSPISLTFSNTKSKSARVCEADIQKRTREVIIGVAG